MTVRKASVKSIDKKAAAKKTADKKPAKKPSDNAAGHKHVGTLKNAKTILLVDWPDKNVPLTLLKAGFMVIGYSPGKYTLLSYKTDYAEDKLVFDDLEGAPGEIEIVNIFRPEAEHEEIFDKHVLPLKAKVVWLQPPIASPKTAKLAKKHNLIFVKGYDIALAAAELSVGK